MKKELLFSSRGGFSIVEVVLATATFALLISALTGSYLYGQEATALAGARARAVLLAEEGLEAVRNIRDENFSNLTAGTYGLATSSNEWVLTGSSDLTGIFTRAITVSDIDPDRKNISCTVTWQQNAQRTGSVTLATRMTNWSKVITIPGSCNDYVIEQGYSAGTCRQSEAQCGNNDETYVPEGDIYCTGGPSAGTCCALPSGGGGDTTPPDAVNDLAASDPTQSSALLSWTAPGDDGATGTAALYDLRYSTATITEGNWASATQVTGEPTPSAAGAGESMTVSGLSAATTYYFAIKTSDEVPNQSPISNIASITTSAAPPATCNSYATGLGYSAGTCRQNDARCTQNGETYLSAGDTYCTGGPSAGACCGAP